MIQSCHDYFSYTHVSLEPPDGGQDPGVLPHVTGWGIKGSQLRKRIHLKIYARSARASDKAKDALQEKYEDVKNGTITFLDSELILYFLGAPQDLNFLINLSWFCKKSYSFKHLVKPLP